MTKTQENITHKRAKRSALSQQVTTRLQGTDNTAWQTWNNKKWSAKKVPPNSLILYIYLTLTFDSHCKKIGSTSVKIFKRSHKQIIYIDPNDIALLCNLRRNMHTIRNKCAKYEHLLSKYERAIRITSYKIDQYIWPWPLTQIWNVSVQILRRRSHYVQTGLTDGWTDERAEWQNYSQCFFDTLTFP